MSTTAPAAHAWGRASAISVVALRRGLLAPWLARAGLVVAALLPLSVVGPPQALLVGWLVAVGLALRAPPRASDPVLDRS